MKKSSNNSLRQAKLQTKKRVTEQKLKRDGVHYKGQLISREKHNQIKKKQLEDRVYWERQRSLFRNHRNSRMTDKELDFMGEIIDRMTPSLPYGMNKFNSHGVRRLAELAATFDVLDSIHTGIPLSQKDFDRNRS